MEKEEPTAAYPRSGIGCRSKSKISLSTNKDSAYLRKEKDNSSCYDPDNVNIKSVDPFRSDYKDSKCDNPQESNFHCEKFPSPSPVPVDPSQEDLKKEADIRIFKSRFLKSRGNRLKNRASSQLSDFPSRPQRADRGIFNDASDYQEDNSSPETEIGIWKNDSISPESDIWEKDEEPIACGAESANKEPTSTMADHNFLNSKEKLTECFNKDNAIYRNMEIIKRSAESRNKNRLDFPLNDSEDRGVKLEINRLIFENIRLGHTTLDLHLETIQKYRDLVITNFRTIDLLMQGLKMVRDSANCETDLIVETLKMIKWNMTTIQDDIGVFKVDMSGIVKDLDIINSNLDNFTLESFGRNSILFKINIKTECIQSHISSVCADLNDMNNILNIVDRKIILIGSRVANLPPEKSLLQKVVAKIRTLLMSIHLYSEKIRFELDATIQKLIKIQKEVSAFLSSSKDLFALEFPRKDLQTQRQFVKSNIASFISGLEKLNSNTKSTEALSSSSGTYNNYFSKPAPCSNHDAPEKSLKKECPLSHPHLTTNKCDDVATLSQILNAKLKRNGEKFEKAFSDRNIVSDSVESAMSESERIKPKSFLMASNLKSSKTCINNTSRNETTNKFERNYRDLEISTNFENKIEFSSIMNILHKKCSPANATDFGSSVPSGNRLEMTPSISNIDIREIISTYSKSGSLEMLSLNVLEVVDSITFTIGTDVRTLNMYKKMIDKDIKYIQKSTIRAIAETGEESDENFNPIIASMESLLMITSNIHTGMDCLKLDVATVYSNIESYTKEIVNICGGTHQIFNSILISLSYIKNNFKHINTDIKITQRDLEYAQTHLKMTPENSTSKLEKLTGDINKAIETIERDIERIFVDIEMLVRYLETIQLDIVGIKRKHQEKNEENRIPKSEEAVSEAEGNNTACEIFKTIRESAEHESPYPKSSKHQKITSQRNRIHSLLDLHEGGAIEKFESGEIKDCVPVGIFEPPRDNISESDATSDSESSQKDHEVVVHLDHDAIKASVENIRKDANEILLEMSSIRKELEMVRSNVEAIHMDMGTIQNNIASFQPDLDNIRKDVDTIYPNMVFIRKDVETITAHIEVIQIGMKSFPDLGMVCTNAATVCGDVQIIQKDIETIRSDLDIIHPDLEILQPILCNIQSDMVMVEKDIQMLRQDLLMILTQMENIQPNVDDQPMDFETVRKNSESFRNDMEMTHLDLEIFYHHAQTMRPDLEVIQWQMEFVQWEMENIRDDLETMRKDFERMRSNIIAGSDTHIMNNDMESIQRDLRVLQKDIEAVRPDLETIHQDIDALRPSLESLQQDMKTIGEDMGNVRTDMDNIKGDISTFQTRYQW